jgi:hypothetical protein
VHGTDFNIILCQFTETSKLQCHAASDSSSSTGVGTSVNGVLWQQCHCFTDLNRLHYHGNMKTSNKTQPAYLQYQPVWRMKFSSEEWISEFCINQHKLVTVINVHIRVITLLCVEKHVCDISDNRMLCIGLWHFSSSTSNLHAQLSW